MLLLLASMIVLGFLLGFVGGGSIRGLKEIHFRMAWILFVSLLVAVLPLMSDSINAHRRIIQLISFAGVLIFLVVNILTSRGELRSALGVILFGWALNFIVIAANGGMPLSRWAYATSGQTSRITQGSGGFYRIVVAGPKTTLLRLGDVIPIRPYHEVLSIGDIFLLLGAALVLAAGMRGIRRAPRTVKEPAH